MNRSIILLLIIKIFILIFYLFKQVIIQQKKNQNQTQKQIQSGLQKRKASLSSRKSSLASRKNSSGAEFESLPNTNLTRSKTQPSSNEIYFLNFYSIQYQPTLQEFIEAAIIDKQMLIQTHIALRLVELLNPHSDQKYPERKNRKGIDEVNEDDSEEEDIELKYNDKNDISEKYKFSNNVLIWSLVVGTISIMKGQIIQESGLFINIVEKYLSSNEEVRQVLLKNILNLTKIVFSSGFQTKEFCNDLLNILFKIIHIKSSSQKQQISPEYSFRKKESENSSSFESTNIKQSQNKAFYEDQDLFQLVNGWLEILLTKETPAPEEFYASQNLQKEWKNCFCKLNAKGASQLYSGISKFLLYQLNFGGIEGVHMADEQIISKLQITEYLLKLLLSTESSYKHLAIIESLSNWHLKDTLRKSYSRCIIWYFFNKPEDVVKCLSPATILMKSIGNLVYKLFTFAVEKQNIAEICIEQLFKHSINFSKTLYAAISESEQATSQFQPFNSLNINNQQSSFTPFMNQFINSEINIPIMNTQSITAFNALSLASRQSKIFQELINLWVVNDQLAQFMVFNINGFSHLLDIIGISPPNFLSKNQDQINYITSISDITHPNTLYFNGDESSQMNLGLFNYISVIQGNLEKSNLQSQSPIQNNVSYNIWNQAQNFQQIQKNPTSQQLGAISQGYNKNFQNNSELFNKSPTSKIDEKKSILLNDAQLSYNSLSSSHIQSSQVLQLASLLAKGTSYLEPGGIFGTSEIHENTKNSFIKYQINHPSFHNNLNIGQAQLGQNNSQLQFMQNNNQNQLQIQQQINQTQSYKSPNSFLFGTNNTINYPILPMFKPNQQNVPPAVIQNTIPSLPPLPSMQYNNQSPQYIPQHPPPPQINQPQQLIKNFQSNTVPTELNTPLKTSNPMNTKNLLEDPLSLLVETECCNQIQLIPQIGQILQVPSGLQDWSYNKKGGKNKVALHLMSGNQHQELQVLLKLNKIVEMKKIKIGFNCQPADFSDQSKIIGIPSGVIIEGGLSENKLVPLGSLQQISDDRYLNYAVKVFVKNFSRIKDETGSISKCIKSLSTPKVNYIKIRIIRPIITQIEDSLNTNKSFNNIAVSINFLSIIGYNLESVSIDVPQHIFKIQTESAIQIIGKLCAEGMGFDKTIEAIANNDSIIQKVKSGFEFIEQQILYHEQSFSQFLICLALNNDVFADWIFDYLLDSSKNKIPLAKLLTEIIISQKIHNNDKILSNKALQRVEKLYEYTVKQVEIHLENNPVDIDNIKEDDGEITLTNIFPFIDALIAAIRISYPHPKNLFEEKQSKYEMMKLRVNKEIIQSLIQIYLKCILSGAEGFSKLSIKLIVSLIYLPTPFYCENQEDIAKQGFNLIWEKIIKQKMYHLSDLMVALVYGGAQCKEQFLVNDAKNYKQLVNALISEMSIANQDKSIIQTQKVKDLFSILSSICSSRRIKKLITQSNNSQSSSSQVPVYIKIYSLIKHKKQDQSSVQHRHQNKLLLQWVDSEFLQLFVEFLKKISQNSKEVIENIVTVLNQDIKELDQKRDELYVNEFLIPILQASSTVPICFHAFDTLQRKWLINPIKVLNHPYYQAKFQQTSKNKNQKNIEKFNTKLLNQEQKQAFIKTLKNFTLDTGLYKKIKKYDWIKESTQEIDNQVSLIGKLENKILNNPPYIIVIEGMNNGQKCLCGVFSSQAIQKSSIDQTYNILNGDDCFIFYYSENYQIHFRIEGNDFGQFNVQLDTSYLTFKYRELDRIYISFSDSNTSYVDINLFDMKPIENGSNIPHDIPNDFSFTKAEYWVLKPQKINIQDEKKSPQAMESMYDSLNSQYLLFQSDYFKQDSPYNFYRSPAVYHFPDDLTLKQVIFKISVPGLSVPKEVLQKFVFNLRQTSKILSSDDDITLKDLLGQIEPNSNGIIDLEYNVDQFFLQSPSKDSKSISLTNQKDNNQEIQNILQQHPQNNVLKILDSFIEQKGFKNIICVIKEQLLNWNNKSRAKKWLVYVQELNLFTVLPKFFFEFMKKKEGVNTLFQLLAGIPDSGSHHNEKQEDTKASQLKQPLMDYSEDYPIMKAFKKSQNNNDKHKEEEKEKNKYYEEQERKAVQNIYEVLSQVFSQDTQDHKIKNIAIENNLLQTIFERISSVSKEKSRKYIDKSQKEEQDNEELVKQKMDLSIVQGVQKTSQGEKDEKSRSKHSKENKKKGIGYASDNTGQNQKWNINEYVEIKKSRSELLISLMKILENFFKFNDWELPPKIIQIICESSLLPLLESAFRSGSLLEICKESQLILQYLKLVEVMSENEGLLTCLMKLDTHYQPVQTESIFDLLTNLRTTAEIFLNCLKPKENDIQDISFTQGLQYSNEIHKVHVIDAAIFQPHDVKSIQIDAQKDIQLTEQEENNILSQQIAGRIISVHEKVEKAINLYNEHQQQAKRRNSQNNIESEIDEEQAQKKKIMQVLELPLDIKYKILLEKQRFGYFSMIDSKNPNQYNHHYKQQISQNQNPSQIKMVRLAQEVADMANSLPVDYTNSMFVRCDSKRVDVMKCIIMGSTGTPYANGAFMYDVFFEDNYPNCSPKVNLQTTGNGKVRFNPNLYNCGKVCLSLLGTWKGQASENWDPKISTLLQVLVSLQAIIMNEDIYFNEPGYEGHSGTEDGEKKNEGYSNIVRYCNIKYAMIEAIRNPPDGFSEIIKRHFYLKKEEILNECEGWVQRSYQKPASYVGLVNDHNALLCQEFKQQNKYSEMLTKAVQELRQELERLTPPASVDTQEEIQKKKQRKLEQLNRQKMHEQIQIKQQGKPTNIKKGEILHNVLNDQEIVETKNAQHMTNMGEEIDIEKEDVKDRWSRYICAMGIDAVAKQSKCSIFLSGLGPLGVEIAKNIVLSGVKRITLHDTQIVSYKDLCGQFFLKEEHIGKNRAESSFLDISQLNHYVRVDKSTIQLTTNTSDFIEKLSLQEYDVIILADTYTLDVQTAINSFCRERSIKFIVSQVQGPFVSLFNDFGDNFEVVDKNGEDPQEVIVSKIEPLLNEDPESKKKTKVTLLPGQKHSYEDGDKVVISQVKGMKLIADENKSINDTIHQIQVINTNSFYLLSNCQEYTPYQGSGVVKNIKTPINLSFYSLKHCIQTNNTSVFDQNMLTHDFEKLDIIPYLHIAFLTLYDFISTHQRYPSPWNIDDSKSFIEIAKPHYDAFDLPLKDNEKMKEKFKLFITKFSFTVSGTFPPLVN